MIQSRGAHFSTNNRMVAHLLITCSPTRANDSVALRACSQVGLMNIRTLVTCIHARVRISREMYAHAYNCTLADKNGGPLSGLYLCNRTKTQH